MKRNEFDVFYSDGDGIRSHSGWYYVEPIEKQPIGPFHAEYAAADAAQSHRDECEELGYP